MAWVTIKGHRYYRRSRRVGGRVVTEHVGRGELADLEAQYDADVRGLDHMDRVARRARVYSDGAEFVAYFEFDDVLACVVSALAHRMGWHRHKRAWRKKRGADMGDIQKLRKKIDKLRAFVDAQPLRAPELYGVPDADRAVLAKAAAGDAAALDAAEPYFSDPVRLRRWGDPMYAARCWLVSQSGGDNAVVQRATHRHATAMRDGLGWEAADALQRLAIVRVVNNWLAVGVLEAKANRIEPGHQSRAAIEKVLSQADRRLMQAVRTLAILRGIKPNEVLARVSAPAITAGAGPERAT
jgi:hypothetical protein